MGKFMRTSALCQFLGAELKNLWYMGVRQGSQPHSCDLKSCSGDCNWCLIKEKSRGTSVNRDGILYFMLLSTRTDAMEPVGMAFTLVYMGNGWA